MSSATKALVKPDFAGLPERGVDFAGMHLCQLKQWN